MVTSGLILILWLRLAWRTERGQTKTLLRLPLSQTNSIQQSWINAKSADGFLDVDNILKDPRTTRDSLQLDSLIVTTPHSSPQPSEQNKVSKTSHKVKSDLLAAKEEHNEDFDSVMTYNSNFVPHITKDVYSEGFVQDNQDACEVGDVEEILLVIIVISAPDHSSHRAAIRSSWGAAGQYREVVITFLVGLPEDPETRHKLQQESEQHGDLVINNMEDHYENLSLKTLSALQWLKNLCPKAKFLLKVDDDMFVQVNRILEKVKKLLDVDPVPRIILGNISKGWRPVRNPKSKYLITESQYPHHTYPDFATGPSYLLSRRAALEILAAALEEKYIHLEDVFLTGVVAESLHIPRLNIGEFKNNAVRVPVQFMGCTIEKSFTIHKVSPQEQEDLHSLARNPNCGRGNSKKNLYLQTKKLLKSAIKEKRHFVVDTI